MSKEHADVGDIVDARRMQSPGMIDSYESGEFQRMDRLIAG